MFSILIAKIRTRASHSHTHHFGGFMLVCVLGSVQVRAACIDSSTHSRTHTQVTPARTDDSHRTACHALQSACWDQCKCARLALSPPHILARALARIRGVHVCFAVFDRGNHSSKTVKLEYIYHGHVQPGMNLLQTQNFQTHYNLLCNFTY